MDRKQQGLCRAETLADELEKEATTALEIGERRKELTWLPIFPRRALEIAAELRRLAQIDSLTLIGEAPCSCRCHLTAEEKAYAKVWGGEKQR